MDTVLHTGRVLHVWGLGVLLVVAAISLVQGSQYCYECLDGEVSTFCNISANHQMCRDETEVCLTEVTNKGGQLYSRKSCLIAAVCNIAASASPEECQSGIVTTRCTYCCIGDKCNYDRFTYSPTTAAPSTTTAIATTPSTTLVDFITTVAPPTCDSQNLTKCVSAYGDVILFAMENPRENFLYYCNHVPSMFQCVANAMATCCPDNQLVVQEKLNLVAESLWAQCPRECDADQGQICTSGIITKVIEGIVFGNSSCTALQREIHVFQTCIVVNVGTCGDVIRVGFENKVKVIREALNITCTSATTTTVAPTGTSSPEGVTTVNPADCDEAAIADICIVPLALNITGSNPPTPHVLCQVLIPEAESCLEEHLASCPSDVRERVERAYNFTLELAGDDLEKCTPTTEAPPVCNTTAARACAVAIYDVIDKLGDYGRACRMVNETVACVLANVTDCTEAEKVSLNHTLDIVLQTLEGRCEKVITMESECKDLTLEEGGEEKAVEFKSNYDPKFLCGGEADCKIYAVITFGQESSPKCRDGTPIEQIVCRPEVPPKAGWPCSAEIRSDNWEDTYRIYIAATNDGKTDGDQVREMTLIYKKVIKGQVKELMSMDTCKVKVIDHDTSGICESLNDPHIKTFDGVKYDNFYEGVFVLYKHQKYPCEVHALYQRCSYELHGTCNCGVAIKSGDYVFLAESCRRRSSYCRRHRCYNMLRAKSYVWDGITDGTRIFRRPTGFEVLLPYGTRIRVQYLKTLNLVDIWVLPSAADFMQTTGLCGVYDGQQEKDLLLPDGTAYSGSDIGVGRQPRDFCKAWRVTDPSHQIYQGASYDPWQPHQYCVCGGFDCRQPDCQADHLVSTCDLDTAGEITFEEMPSVMPGHADGRHKREAEGPSVFEFDLDYEPPEDPRKEERTWTEDKAKIFCQDYFAQSKIAQACRFNVQTELEPHIDICVQDIALADDTTFAVSALEGLKETCLSQVQTDPKFTETDTGRRAAEDVDNMKCSQDCSKKGKCVKGKCVCDTGFSGEICNVASDAVPDDVNGGDETLCDVRRANCSLITVFANDVIKSDKLTCHLEVVQVTEEDATMTQDKYDVEVKQEVEADWISSSQVTCNAPRHRAMGLYVTLSNDGVHYRPKSSFIHIRHDPVCHTCVITDNEAHCERKPNTCIIENRCYFDGESLPSDACSVCDPSHSDHTFKRIKSIACIGATMVIVVLVVVIVVIVLVAVVIMICCCKGGKKKRTPEEGVRHELISKFRSLPSKYS